MTNEDSWFYLGSDDEPQGPVTRAALLELVRTGIARENALVWRDGFGGWRPFSDVEQELKNPGAAAAIQPVAKPAPAKPPPAAHPPVKEPGVLRAVRVVERTHLALGAAFAVAAVVIVSVLYQFSGPTRAEESSPAAVMHQAELRQPVEVAPEIEVIPVRVKNPFDATEVFEFPPGTSEAAARDAVADLLLKRAMQRRSQMTERRSRVTERRSKKKA